MLVVKIIAGVLIGGTLGVFMGQAKVCGSGQCSAKPNLIASIIAGAIFGAAVAYYFAR